MNLIHDPRTDFAAFDTVLIYGTGKCGRTVYDVLSEIGVSVKGYLDSFLQGSIAGVPVRHWPEVATEIESGGLGQVALIIASDSIAAIRASISDRPATHSIVIFDGFEFYGREMLWAPRAPERYRVAKNFGFGQGLPDIELTDMFPGLRETVQISGLSDGSSAFDYALLMGLARRFPDCEFLEVGCWRGETLLNMTGLMAHGTGLTLGPQDLRRLGFPAAMSEQTCMFSKDLPNVSHVYADSKAFDFAALDRRFDLVFIDADHTWEAVANDTRKALPLLRDEHSVIVWHDYSRGPENGLQHTCWEVLGGILEGMPSKLHPHLYHVANTMCAVFTREPQHARHHEFPRQPQRLFSITIEAGPELPQVC